MSPGWRCGSGSAGWGPKVLVQHRDPLREQHIHIERELHGPLCVVATPHATSLPSLPRHTAALEPLFPTSVHTPRLALPLPSPLESTFLGCTGRGPGPTPIPPSLLAAGLEDPAVLGRPVAVAMLFSCLILQPFSP